MRSLLAVAAVALVASLSNAAQVQRPGPTWDKLDAKYSFEQYCADHGKVYQQGTPEYNLRKKNFEANLAQVLQHNSVPGVTYNKGINHMSDWSRQDHQKRNRAIRPRTTGEDGTKANYIHQVPQGYIPPGSVDYRTWTNPRVLTGIKDQGFCGDCWSHGATESMESYFALLTGQLKVFSQQQTTSCTNMTGCWTFQGQAIGGGCGGGMAEKAFDAVKSYGGIIGAWEYPFTDYFVGSPFEPNTTTSACKQDWFINKTFPWATTDGYVHVNTNDANATMHALATRGPLTVYVAAGYWDSYESGIFTNNATGGWENFETDHVVQLVGYGHDDDLNKDYWIVRNSWGTWWGEDGFIRLLRDGNENAPCGLDAPDFLKCGDVHMHRGQQACGTSSVLVQPVYPIMKKTKLP